MYFVNRSVWIIDAVTQRARGLDNTRTMNQTTFCRSQRTYAVLTVIAVCFLLASFSYEHVQHRAMALVHSVLRNKNVSHADVAGQGYSNVPSHLSMANMLPSHVTMEAVSDACSDDKLAPNLETSTLAIQDQKKVYKIGDMIVVKVQLKNAHGKPITRGGAIIRARMFTAAKQAYSTGPVTDHGTGVYTVRFQALWTGNCTIKVKIAYTPETIRAVLNFRKKLRSTREIEARFSVGQFTEFTLCHPTVMALEATNYTSICNLTMDNSGMPWYCGKPSNVHLLCEDWEADRMRNPYPTLPMTTCEETLLSRSHKDMTQSLNVIVERTPTILSDVIQPPTTPCRDYDISALWTLNQTTGFMYKNTWHLRQCKGFQTDRLFPCIRNTKFLLFGDSTVRQWYTHIVKAWSCKPSTEKWSTDKWHKRTACRNEKHNFTVQWLPHSHPFFGVDTNRYTRSSISRHLEETGNNERVVALIHTYMHTSAYHPSIFRDRMQRIRTSVDNLLKRNKFVKFFIKAPHTYYNTPAGRYRLSDYIGMVYDRIMYEVFWGLHDRIVYLNNRDAADSSALDNNHPPDHIVAGMVNQMLAYLC